MKIFTKTLLLIAGILLYSCNSGSSGSGTESQNTNIMKETFGKMPDGQEVFQYTMTNKNGLEMKVINYGGIITSLKVPDRNGKLEDVVLGYDNLESYLKMNPYFGAIIGRYGNRIAKGKFTLDDTEYTLATNNIGNHLHGGIKGFDKVFWKAETFENESTVGIKFNYLSEDMEEGYPGNLNATVTYTLGDDNTLAFEYEASTDKKTIVNLTQHSYFNFSGKGTDILNHELMLNASAYLPVDSTLIPTGEFRNVSGTPFDFTSPKTISKDIAMENNQLKIGGGYDHCWVLDQGDEDLNLAASLFEPESGRYMEVFTTEPGIQFYSGNFLDGSAIGKNNTTYGFRSGLCLETQHFPDSPNQEEFPSVTLNADAKYYTKTVLKFSTK